MHFDEIIGIVGKHNALIPNAKGSKDLALEYLEEQRKNYSSHPDLIIFPSSALEISQIIKLCNQNNIKIVVQGGNTGLVGGSVASSGCILLNMKNFNYIKDINKETLSCTAGAGVTLEQLHDALGQEDMEFAVNLASQGKCTIGGITATNAGGLNALQYGLTRDNVISISAIMPNGDIIQDTHNLKKRNIGISVKDLLIGSEGKFGIIYEVSLRCTPSHIGETNLSIESNNLSQILKYFNTLQGQLYPLINAFEICNNTSLKLASNNSFPYKYLAICKVQWYNKHFESPVKQSLQAFMKDIKVDDKINILSTEDSAKLWQIRESIPGAQKLYSEKSIKNDISVPINNIAQLIKEVESYTASINKELVAFGHIGDGNIHINIPCTKDYYLNNSEICKNDIAQIAISLGGTFSAEHGIGLVHKDRMKKYYPHHLKMIRQIQCSLDIHKTFSTEPL